MMFCDDNNTYKKDQANRGEWFTHPLSPAVTPFRRFSLKALTPKHPCTMHQHISNDRMLSCTTITTHILLDCISHPGMSLAGRTKPSRHGAVQRWGGKTD